MKNLILCFALISTLAAATEAHADRPRGNRGQPPPTPIPAPPAPPTLQEKYFSLLRRVVTDIQKSENQMIVGRLNQPRLNDFLDANKVRFIGGHVPGANCYITYDNGLMGWENFAEYDRNGYLRLPVAIHNGEIYVSAHCWNSLEKESQRFDEEGTTFRRFMTATIGMAVAKYLGLPYSGVNRAELSRLHAEVVMPLYNIEAFGQLYRSRLGFVQVAQHAIDEADDSTARMLGIDKNRLRQAMPCLSNWVVNSIT